MQERDEEVGINAVGIDETWWIIVDRQRSLPYDRPGRREHIYIAKARGNSPRLTFFVYSVSHKDSVKFRCKFLEKRTYEINDYEC